MPSRDTVARERELSRLGGEGNPFVSWSLGQHPREVIRPRRVTWSWSTDGWIPANFTEHRTALELADPTDASASWARGQELVQAAQNVVADNVRDEIGDQLAAGAVGAADVHRLLAKKPTREDALRRAKDERAAITLGARRAGIAGCDAVRDFGDGWKPIVHDVIERALRDRNDELWNLGHAFAKFLRDAQRPRLCGLASLADSAKVDAPLAFYMFKRPDLVQRWRIARAGPGELREVTRFRDAERSVWISVIRLKSTVPFPKVAEFDESWGAGFWAAEQVVQHLAEIRGHDSRELDALASPREPATRKPAPRHAVVA